MEKCRINGNSLAAYSTATARFYNGYTPVNKWVIVATIACPQSRDFKRWALINGKREEM